MISLFPGTQKKEFLSFGYIRQRNLPTPPAESRTHIFSLFRLVCFVHSSLPLPGHKASQGHRAQRGKTLRTSGWVGGPRLSELREQDGWRVEEGGGPINLPEPVFARA